MADTTTTKTGGAEEISSIDAVVRVKDLTDAHTNPNIPRSVFDAQLNGVDPDPDKYTSVTSLSATPSGKNWQDKTVKVKAVQMNAPFDADGETGNSGDWLVHMAGKFYVMKNL